MIDLQKYEYLESSFERMKNSSKPVYIYGTGNGCDKILRQCERHNVTVSGIFVSDDFARGQIFHGFKVETFSAVREREGDFIICLAFGTSLPEVMERIDALENQCELIAPDTSVIGDDAFDKKYLSENPDRIQKAYSLMSDSHSRKVFENLIAYKITGKLDFLREIFTLPHKFGDIISLGDEEIYCDMGAYNGDTVLEFSKAVNGKYQKIYAVEPEKRNFQKCLKSCLHLENIQLVNSAVWDKNGVMSFSGGGGRQAQISLCGENLIPTISLDSLLDGRACTYVKYDVEGADRQALQGSAKTLKRYSPKICCAVYHRCYDFIELPLLIDELCGGYRFYMRQYPYYPCWETNLFAVLS